MRAQTTLPEDVGLSVDVVSPDSPAAKAGLKAHDILAKYDDQLLCAAVQLSALVKRTGTGNKAPLIVLRGGKELPIDDVDVDVEIEDDIDDDETFLEEEEERDDDVIDLIDGDIEKDEEV